LGSIELTIDLFQERKFVFISRSKQACSHQALRPFLLINVILFTAFQLILFFGFFVLIWNEKRKCDVFVCLGSQLTF
jgi:hypothetical protein